MAELQKFWIVAGLGENGLTSHFTSRKAAEEAARKLAAENFGKQFVVLEALSRFQGISPEVREERFVCVKPTCKQFLQVRHVQVA